MRLRNFFFLYFWSCWFVLIPFILKLEFMRVSYSVPVPYYSERARNSTIVCIFILIKIMFRSHITHSGMQTMNLMSACTWSYMNRWFNIIIIPARLWIRLGVFYWFCFRDLNIYEECVCVVCLFYSLNINCSV